jgi:hypothetical protein
VVVSGGASMILPSGSSRAAAPVRAARPGRR